MPAERDPLSVRYDRAARRVLLAAVAAHKLNRHATAWIPSPPAEFRQLDRGGRTRSERAFTRAAYYQVIKVPQHTGTPRYWSLKLSWGPIGRRGGRWGREVRARLYRAGSGARKIERNPGTAYTVHPELRASIGDDGQRIVGG